MIAPKTLYSYRFAVTVTSAQLAAAFQQHQAAHGCPTVIRVNPKISNLVAAWLKTSGHAVEVQPNGGTFSNEVWLA